MVETLPWRARRKIIAALKAQNYVTAMNLRSNHWKSEQWMNSPLTSKAKSGVRNQIDLKVFNEIVQKLE